MDADKMIRSLLALLLISIIITPAFALDEPYPTSKFVEASYEMTPDGVIQFGESVWATITLTNFSKEINESKFFFYSDLKSPQWSVAVDGVAVDYEQPLVINHSADTATVALAGRAPDAGWQKEIVIARIDENTTTNDYTVITIKRTVTSDEIYEILTAIDESRNSIELANQSIRNATIDTSDAKDDLGMAQRYFEDAENHYKNKDFNASLAAAENATYYANKAYEGIENIESSANLKKYLIYGVIALILIAVVVILYQRSKWDKLGR